MDNKLDEFITEITNLKINVVVSDGREYLDLSHYNQFNGGFEYQITDLATKINFSEATSYILNLKKIELKFIDFWEWYNVIYNSFCNGTFSPTKVDFKHDIKRYFNVPNFDESGILTLKFLNDLHDAAMFKHGELTGLINEIQNLIAPKKQTETNTLPRLQTSLTTTQRDNLFDELVNGGFIPDENRDCFNWAINATNETEPKPPGQWQPIKWNKTKFLLAYFVDIFNCEILGNDGINKRTQWKPFELLFGETGLRGSKNDYQKTGSLPDGHKQIEQLIKSLK